MRCPNSLGIIGFVLFVFFSRCVLFIVFCYLFVLFAVSVIGHLDVDSAH
jgi:hypothetical protein